MSFPCPTCRGSARVYTTKAATPGSDRVERYYRCTCGATFATRELYSERVDKIIAALNDQLT